MIGHRVFVDCAFFPKCGLADGWVAFVDGLSKILNVKILYSNKASSVIVAHAQAVLDMFQQRNIVPTNITFVSDNGGEFRSNDITQFTARTGCNWHHVPAGRPQANGAVERIQATIKDILRKLQRERGHKRWPELISEVVDMYNNKVHTSTGFSPNYIINTLHPSVESVVEVLQRAQLVLERKELIETVKKNIATKNQRKNTNAQMKKVGKAGFTIASSFVPGTAVLVKPPAKFKTTEKGFKKKAVVEKNCGNGYYVIRFLETGGYRNTEVEDSTAKYYRKDLKLYTIGADHQLTMEPVDGEEEVDSDVDYRKVFRRDC